MPDDRPVLLMLEDDLGLRRQFKWSQENCQVVTAVDRESCMAALRRHEPAVVTLDLGLPPYPETPDEGFRTIEEILDFAPHTKVIALTGQSDRANALKAIALGACDFIEKPFELDILSLVLTRAFRVADLEAENRRLTHLQERQAIIGLTTSAPAVLEVCQQVKRLAPTDASVLLSGESGTGKELLSRSLHDESSPTTC